MLKNNWRAIIQVCVGNLGAAGHTWPRPFFYEYSECLKSGFQTVAFCPVFGTVLFPTDQNPDWLA